MVQKDFSATAHGYKRMLKSVIIGKCLNVESVSQEYDPNW